MSLSRPQSGWRPRLARVVAGVVAGVSGEDSAGQQGQEQAIQAAGGIEQLLDLVVVWNARMDLTAARDVDELVDLYLADAVALAAAGIEPGERWVDVGSGGGAPGLVLALLVPGLRLTLIEPRAKRVAFLRSALGAIGMDAVDVQRARSDVLPAGGWDVAVSRATLAPPDWLAEGARLARCGVWVLLARAEPPAHPGWRIDRDISYRWPLTGARRRAVRYVPAENSPGPAT